MQIRNRPSSESLARKKSLNGFSSRKSIFSNLLAVWDVSLVESQNLKQRM